MSGSEVGVSESVLFLFRGDSCVLRLLEEAAVPVQDGLSGNILNTDKCS